MKIASFGLQLIPICDRYREKTYEVTLFDNAGTETYDRLRPLIYPSTDVFIVCTLLGDSAHLDFLKDDWFPEIHHFNNTKAPIILVGVRPGPDFYDEDGNRDRIRRDNLPGQHLKENERFAKSVGAWKYLECDMLDLPSVDAVFEQVRSSVSEDSLPQYLLISGLGSPWRHRTQSQE